MTTDKDEARKLVKYAYKAIRFNKAAFVVTDFIPPVEKEIARIRAESAEQARKETAERAVNWYNRIDPLDPNTMSEQLRAVILNDSVTEGKTAAEKLAIAIEALKIIQATCHDGLSITYRECNNALKKICV